MSVGHRAGAGGTELFHYRAWLPVCDSLVVGPMSRSCALDRAFPGQEAETTKVLVSIFKQVVLHACHALAGPQGALSK